MSKDFATARLLISYSLPQLLHNTIRPSRLGFNPNEKGFVLIGWRYLFNFTVKTDNKIDKGLATANH